MIARFEIVRTSAGHHARYIAANGQTVWTTETYDRRASAENAILALFRGLGWPDAELIWNAEPTEKVVQARPGLTLPPLVRYVDDRPWPLTMDDLEPPYYFREVTEYAYDGRRVTSTQVPFWHDREYHHRNCFDEDCTQGEPPKGTSVCGRFGRVVMR